MDIGLRATVPGANDNLTGVAAILSLAHALAGAGGPPEGVRVILPSAGAEESHQEGMTDTAERVDYARVADAARLCQRLVERLAPEREPAAAEQS